MFLQTNCVAGNPCLKHYVDSSDASSKGYSFLCTCPLGYHCPVTLGEQKINTYDLDGSDSYGAYMYGYCTEIPGWSRDPSETADTNT